MLFLKNIKYAMFFLVIFFKEKIFQKIINNQQRAACGFDNKQLR